jgi:inorganic pyrophosphatase/exopolyphosphatase
LDLCLAKIPIDVTYSQALIMMREQFLKSIEMIHDLIIKKKIDLHVDLISISFEKIFNEMENSLQISL